MEGRSLDQADASARSESRQRLPAVNGSWFYMGRVYTARCDVRRADVRTCDVRTCHVRASDAEPRVPDPGPAPRDLRPALCEPRPAPREPRTPHPAPCYVLRADVLAASRPPGTSTEKSDGACARSRSTAREPREDPTTTVAAVWYVIAVAPATGQNPTPVMREATSASEQIQSVSMVAAIVRGP